ncbi:MAG: VCBS repeat-containing protein [Proteobacteria bacterium]|nr:VCBS repeat-containing protein [Pseudomonadota bacterium]
MKTKAHIIFALSVLICIVSACNDDSVNASNVGNSCQCEKDQVCAANGICYDDPGCAKCEADQVCVGGYCFSSDDKCAQCDAKQSCVNEKCYDADHACAKCDPQEVCVGKKCYASDSKCAKCNEDQACINEKCYDADDPCAKCKDGQVCIGKQCLDKSDPCAKCKEDQVCANQTCYEEGDPCISCTKGQNCIDGKCIDPNDKSCESECTAPDYCEDGICQKCENVCEDNCCSDGQTCDLLLKQCGQACEDPSQVLCGDDCCSADQECDQAYGCSPVCVDGESTRCEGKTSVSCCSNETEECLNGSCVPICAGTRCGEDQLLCCEDKTPVCEDNVCKIKCDAEKRCGASDEFCCKDEEICINNTCSAHGDKCSKSSDCNFDEICEESTQLCVNEDNIPSTCQVIPKFSEFKANLQWHWPNDLPGGVPSTDPDYIRVIVMPMAANLTDDNNDGAVNEDDVPDVAFIAYSTKVGPDHQAPSVLRVISGDDGHEIASSKPRYWTYPLDAVIADIDDDGKAEIILGTNHHRVYTSGSTTIDFSTGEAEDYLEALSVEKDSASPTGYSLKTKYQLQITKGRKLFFLSVANIDGKDKPEIITNDGVASIVTDGSGNKKLEWREGCKNVSLGYPHAADLDGDTIMELVTGPAILNDHCQTLASGGSGGHIAIANLMPSGDDAATTGELIPEIAHAISGVGGGQFEFWKVYKVDQGGGNYKWSMSKAWNAPIPVDQKREIYTSNNCPGSGAWVCQSGAGTPVIADFNKDGTPDIGVAARYYYIVYSNDGTPNGGKVLWADSKTIDYSSASTGSSVFDFEGDGIAEVVYGDEQHLHIYSGSGSGVDNDGDGYNDPKEIFSVANWSATGQEYPIVVDVDNDGSTEIVIASDLLTNNNETVGVRAFEDPGGQWVRTRRIWNQHYYHVTNINEDGTVPLHEVVNWTHPKLNNYRQNVQPSGVYNAPNLVATGMTSDQKECEKGILKLTAKVENQGSLGIKAGLSVKFYAVVTIDGKDQKVLIGEKKVETVMPPGANASVTLDWNQEITVDGKKIEIKSPVKIYYIVDEPTEGKSFGEFVECKEDDNAIAAQDVDLCPTHVY